MKRKVLKNKPLVEAIFELRWNLQEPAPGMRIDPHYKLLIGRIYDRVKDEYPFHEQLPTATMPDEIAGYVVQHRFRRGKEKWPLIQIGPGIITLNDTEGYVWDDFEKRIFYLITTLFETYPDVENNLKVNGLLLRYIDATTFDFEKKDIFSFLKEQLKTDIKLHQELFEGTSVGSQPLGLDLRFSFPSSTPKGAVHLRFHRGKKKEFDALIWETMVQSGAEDVPETIEGIAAWINDAHSLTDDWFFNRNLLPLFDIDLSSAYPHFEVKSKTSSIEEAIEEIVPDEMLEFDVFARMPPVKEYTIRVKIKSVESAIPHIVEPEGV